MCVCIYVCIDVCMYVSASDHMPPITEEAIAIGEFDMSNNEPKNELVRGYKHVCMYICLYVCKPLL